MTNLRIFFVGGLISYRALFNWLNPWIFLPTLVVAPIFQVLFFAFLGRSAGLESDRFYVIGNALQIAALPGLFAGRFIEHGCIHAFALRPTKVHAKQYGSPVLRFSTAGPRLDRHYGVQIIVFTRKQCSCLKLSNVGFRGSKLAIKFFEQVVALLRVCFFLSQMDVRFEVARKRREFLIRRNLVFGALAIAQDPLCGFLVIPKVRLSDARFQGFYAPAMLGRVKDSSVPTRCAAGVVRNDAGGLLES